MNPVEWRWPWALTILGAACWAGPTLAQYTTNERVKIIQQDYANQRAREEASRNAEATRRWLEQQNRPAPSGTSGTPSSLAVPARPCPPPGAQPPAAGPAKPDERLVRSSSLALQGWAKEAFTELRAAAAAGSVIAQYDLGHLYREGQAPDPCSGFRVEPDRNQSIYWLGRAATSGFGMARDDLQRYFGVVDGIDTRLAGPTPAERYAQWLQGKQYAAIDRNRFNAGLRDLQRAAEAGYLPAQRDLAYQLSVGEPQRYKYWLERAAAQGDADSRQKLLALEQQERKTADLLAPLRPILRAEPLAPLSPGEQNSVIGRALEMSRLRVSALGKAFDAASALPAERAGALLEEVHQDLMAAERALLAAVASAPSAPDRESLTKLQAVLNEGTCTAERPSGCTGWIGWLEGPRPESLWSKGLPNWASKDKLDVVMCHGRISLGTWGCGAAAKARERGSAHALHDPAAPAMALGYHAQACARYLEAGYPVVAGAKTPCSEAMLCISNGQCGPTDFELAAAFYRLACARGQNPDCSMAYRQLAASTERLTREAQR